MPILDSGKPSRWAEKLSRSGYFFGAVLFHLLLFMMVASWIIWKAPKQPEPETVAKYVPLPPIEVPQTPTTTVTPPPMGGIATTIHTSLQMPGNPVDIKFPSKGFTMGDLNLEHKQIIETRPIVPLDGPSKERLQRFHDTVFDKWQRNWKQVASHDPSCTFPVYIASYADGDWACNTRLDAEGNIVAGSIPDLVAKINEWSHGSIKGEVVPKPLVISSPDLLDKMPPFIFFTGHKDFVLTDAEVENLRSYLHNGGAIWGDNALAGAGSRFDVAFRREMKRVVPDLNKNFEPFSLTDDIFTKGRHPIDKVPVGMNYYAELPQHLDIDGLVAIIYTPNDYSDIMFMRVLPGDKDIYIKSQVPPNTLYTDQGLWSRRELFYRNFNLESCLAVHRLGMNIVSFLLVRFDDKLLLAP